MSDRTGHRALPLVAVPECTDCGACCFSSDRSYIRVFDVDAKRMDARALALTVLQNGLRYMRFDQGRCAALALRPPGARVGCTIHPMRPDACRWLERGSGECLAQVEAKSAVRDAALAGRGSSD